MFESSRTHPDAGPGSFATMRVGDPWPMGRAGAAPVRYGWSRLVILWVGTPPLTAECLSATEEASPAPRQ